MNSGLSLSLAIVFVAVAVGAQSSESAAANPVASGQVTSGAGTAPVSRADFIATMDTEFRKIDADKNNVLTRIEIEQWERILSVAHARERHLALFAQLDTDRSGQISIAEFAALQTPSPPPNAGPLLAQTDLNRDQSVTLIEYRAGKLSNFDQIDTDKDGVVGIAEISAGIIK